MVAPSKAVAFIELEDYLGLETASQYKHEYLDGVVYAIQGEPVRGMAGGSQIHGAHHPQYGLCVARPPGRPGV